MAHRHMIHNYCDLVCACRLQGVCGAPNMQKFFLIPSVMEHPMYMYEAPVYALKLRGALQHAQWLLCSSQLLLYYSTACCCFLSQLTLLDCFALGSFICKKN